ncbi:MAG: hypothetical protein H6600_02900 [Flavobacteriales bacterium]|nr:hypothetical protein [Flavobacteriales bacterium]MCB9197379.1 hypothetical protein [Flavobacteriales bacterium]
MKKTLLILAISGTLVACQNQSNEDNSVEGNETSSETNDQLGSTEEDLYAGDWEEFKQAVISKDKDAVLFFASKQDQDLIDVLDLSYDYIFDDAMIEVITNMNYSDLPVSGLDNNWKELGISYSSEEDGEIYESGTYLYFEERPEGLRIVNFLAAG